MKKIILFIAMLFAFQLGVNAQSAATVFFNDASDNLPDIGTNFDVAIDVTGFDATSMPLGITAITIYFEYDNTVLNYTGYADDIGGDITTDVVELTETVIKVEVYDWTNMWFNIIKLAV